MQLPGDSRNARCGDHAAAVVVSALWDVESCLDGVAPHAHEVHRSETDTVLRKSGVAHSALLCRRRHGDADGCHHSSKVWCSTSMTSSACSMASTPASP